MARITKEEYAEFHESKEALRMGQMDRFKLPFEPEEVASCQGCSHEIYKGEEVVEYDSSYFCNAECLLEYLLSQGAARKVGVE